MNAATADIRRESIEAEVDWNAYPQRGTVVKHQRKRELKISDVSRLTGVPISTLRLWGDRGLLQPDISPTGYRLFTEDHVKQATNIKRLRTIQGLSIAAVKATLAGNISAEDQSSEPNPEPIAEAVGTKLRALRQAAKLTLREVAEKTGISASVLASIERTSLGVHIPEAKSLAAFYGVTLTSLMSGQSSNSGSEIVIREHGGSVLPTLGKGLRVEQLGSGREMMDCQRWYIEPGVGSHGSYSHDGEEFVYVLLGEFDITLEDSRSHHLRQGESIYFKSTWKHSWRNPGHNVCVLLWVNTPPTF
ncbi:MerR family transcriptional regulator [Bradyrhizobium manausense]|jgi:DNA-binding transcriptional MerR regulator/mannose-6-phosphate isomerase-like protein (cupin superfamily)|uniref:MerR family transcriptional regulator n=1 Tax=Bradyrhizobium manausense TaxID=989370 RepID=UPI001BADA455|nr:MerR family transcriptional regulator [Bradyrhizobium manausense]MBR1089385.1 MerR family transcriptional regulator [Bradyrhizobium manausense]